MLENICVVMVTYNRLEWLKKSINCLLDQEIKFSTIIVVDNASTDGTDLYLEEIKSKNDNLYVLKMNKNLGGAGGFFEGIKFYMETFEEGWISLMDDDCIVNKKFVKKWKNLEKIKDYTYTPFVYNIEDGKLNRLFSKNMRKVNEKIYEKDIFPFNGFTIHSSFIKKIGLPEKDYFIYGDDYEYCYRVLKNGGKNLAVKELELEHPNKTDCLEKRKGLKIAKNNLTILTAYYGTRNMILNKKKYKSLMKYSWYKMVMLIGYRLFIYLYLNERKLLKVCMQGVKDGLMMNKKRRVY